MNAKYWFVAIIALLLVIPFIYTAISYQPVDDIVVCGFYYPWYGSEDYQWADFHPVPSLGQYDSRCPAVIEQHDSWASDYGIDVFFMSWQGHDGQGEWIDETIKDHILPNLHDTQFAILYESELRLERTAADTTSWWGMFYNWKIDFNNQNNVQTLIDDFRYLSSTYFDHPLYYKIDGRPVVYFYSAKIFHGNYQGALDTIREDVEMLTGYDMYLVGDVVYWQPSPLSVDVARHFDGISAYNMVIPMPDIESGYVDKVLFRYNEWNIVADTMGVGFIPSVHAGFDEADPSATSPVIAKDVSQFEKFCEGVKTFIPDNGLVFVPFNEHYEGSSVEPYDEYGTEYLEVIRRSFGS